MIGFKTIQILFCECQSAPLTLLCQGLFACSPVLPTLAVDINLLELVTINSHYLAPNITGWTLTLEWFWQAHGFVLGPRVRSAHILSTTGFG